MSKPIFKVDSGICAPCAIKNKSKAKFKTCYSKESLIKIANIWNKHNSSDTKMIDTKNKSIKVIWDQIHKKFSAKCKKNEACWKRDPLIKKMRDPEITMYTFKPDFPKVWKKNKYTWLNTYDIYYVMKQYEKAYDDFIFLGPIPSDCPTKIKCELTKLDLIGMKKNNFNKVGIIYNLDISSGQGTHWVAMYIDNKNNEINYYDSYGSKPVPLINNFIKSLVDKYTEHNFKSTVIYNDKRHQYGHSECGVYSMNFILERLHGTTMYDISQVNIPDKKMNHLRKLLYNLN